MGQGYRRGFTAAEKAELSDRGSNENTNAML